MLSGRLVNTRTHGCKLEVLGLKSEWKRSALLDRLSVRSSSSCNWSDNDKLVAPNPIGWAVVFFLSNHNSPHLFVLFSRNYLCMTDGGLTRAFWRILLNCIFTWDCQNISISVSGSAEAHDDFTIFLQKYFSSYKNSWNRVECFLSICSNAFWNGNGNDLCQHISNYRKLVKSHVLVYDPLNQFS